MSLLTKWDGMYMSMAHSAAEMSQATKLKVGAIAVKDRNVIGIGINGTPTGWYTNEDTNNQGRTKQCVLHAEENLISKLARGTNSSDGATLYCTHAPCIKCSRLIVQSGFDTTIYHHSYKNEDGLSLMRDLGMKVLKYYV